MRQALRRLMTDETGIGTVEYALLLVLIVVAASTAWHIFGRQIAAKVSGASQGFGSS
ncbi:hypothetical protein LLH03_09655 [bacterium]|nr:hypothetical protein [bacterium]